MSYSVLESGQVETGLTEPVTTALTQGCFGSMFAKLYKCKLLYLVSVSVFSISIFHFFSVFSFLGHSVFHLLCYLPDNLLIVGHGIVMYRR